MKKIYVISLVALLLIGFLGCKEDFLEVNPTQFLSEKQVAEAAENNPDVVAGSMKGIYTLMFQMGTGGSGADDPDHDDFGQKGYDIFTDFLSGDMALSISSYNWYRTITDFTVTSDYTRIGNYRPWRYYYRLIRSANSVISALGGNEIEPELDENKFIMGQAKAIRAHSYFYLAQLYANEYNPSEPILPIYTDPTQPNQPKSTTQEVYTLIVKDLTEAIGLLENFNRSAKNEINKYVAEGILAYVYATMGGNENLTNAKNLTNNIILNGGFSITDSTEVVFRGDPTIGGFNKVTSPDWMWGVDITLDNGLDLVSWWGQMDAFTYSYQWAGDRKVMDKSLYDAIPASDVRKNQFYTSNNYELLIPGIRNTAGIIVYSSGYFLTPVGKFYHQDRVLGRQRNIETDYVYMRVAEMYLLNAEVSAKLGDDITARASLKELMKLRVSDTNYINNLSGQALQDEIYLQTRIEFWGEGKSYLALKRNKATTVRGSNHLSFVGVPIPYNDSRLTFEIPQTEIQNNPYID